MYLGAPEETNMEAASYLLMSWNNVFLKSIPKVFQLPIYFNPQLTSYYSPRLVLVSLFGVFFITTLQLSVNLMAVRSCSWKSGLILNRKQLMQWLYIPEFINHLGFFFFLDVDNGFRSRIVERDNLDAHKNFYGPCKETAATIFTQGLDLQTCAELSWKKKNRSKITLGFKAHSLLTWICLLYCILVLNVNMFLSALICMWLSPSRAKLLHWHTEGQSRKTDELIFY